MGRRRQTTRRHKRKTGRSKEAKEKGRRGGRTIIKEGEKVRRNEPCFCGSGLKFKACHGKPKTPRNVMRYNTLEDMYTDEQRAAMREFSKYWGFHPDPMLLKMFMEEDYDAIVAEVTRAMRETGADPAHIYAVQQVTGLVTPRNHGLLSEAELELWERMVQEYRDQHPEEGENDGGQSPPPDGVSDGGVPATG